MFDAWAVGENVNKWLHIACIRKKEIGMPRMPSYIVGVSVFWWTRNCNLVLFSVWHYCGSDGRSKQYARGHERDMDAYVRKTRSLESVWCYKDPALLEQLICILGAGHELLVVVIIFQSYGTRTRMTSSARSLVVLFLLELDWLETVNLDKFISHLLSILQIHSNLYIGWKEGFLESFCIIYSWSFACFRRDGCTYYLVLANFVLCFLDPQIYLASHVVFTRWIML